MNNGKNDPLLTGNLRLNAMLKEAGGLTQRQFAECRPRLPIAIDSPDVLSEGNDVINGAKTVLAVKNLTQNGSNRPDTRTVFVVYSEPAGAEKGMFFITRTLAEVHFANITGSNKEACNELSGGRTLGEMITYLFLT